jgi:hypothetical protein
VGRWNVKWNSVDIMYKNYAPSSQKTHGNTTKKIHFIIVWAEIWRFSYKDHTVECLNVQSDGP